MTDFLWVFQNFLHDSFSEHFWTDDSVWFSFFYCIDSFRFALNFLIGFLISFCNTLHPASIFYFLALQPRFTCPKSIVETLEQCVNFPQRQQKRYYHDVNNVMLVLFFLTLSRFITISWCFHCWLRTSKWLLDSWMVAVSLSVTRNNETTKIQVITL